MQPIRGDIHVAAELPEDPSTMTLRDAVEWHKNCVRTADRLGTATVMELRHIEQSWLHLMGVLSKREKVPQGWLGYLIGELARTEMRAAEAAGEALELTEKAVRDATT